MIVGGPNKTSHHGDPPSHISQQFLHEIRPSDLVHIRKRLPTLAGGGERGDSAGNMSGFFGLLGGGGKEDVDGLKTENGRLKRECEQMQIRVRAVEAQISKMAAAVAPAPAPQQSEAAAGGLQTGASPSSKPGELDHFIATAQISIFGIDLDGKVNVWNSRVEELMGKKAKDVVGRTLYDVLSDSTETPLETRTEVISPCHSASK